uniref:SJCHGC03327 protein n=1 Tax=Schistosoma japonicum TaxID=6182 RepID=Q5DAE7_SCHJA|nr:SJCHGC03327 protein [Schistosoma japonicum]
MLDLYSILIIIFHHFHVQWTILAKWIPISLQWEFYGLSEFYYTLETLKGTPPVEYNYSLVRHKTQEICSTPWTIYLSKLKEENPNLSEEKFNSFVSFKKLICFKASYLLSAFHKGLHFPTDYDKFIPTLEINKTELQWSLGALLYKLKATTAKEEYQWKIIFISVVVICILIILIFIGTLLYLKLNDKCSRTNKQSQNGSVTTNTNNIESFVKNNSDTSSQFDDKIASS